MFSKTRLEPTYVSPELLKGTRSGLLRGKFPKIKRENSTEEMHFYLRGKREIISIKLKLRETTDRQRGKEEELYKES